ncbi:MAG: hypothetical protein IKJ69_04190 [Clostridia bacterium]|nr:hypothetical protein [Clostridia bacterium]
MKTLRTILILISVVLFLLCSCAEDEAVTTVAVVNGETVTQEEFDYFKARKRADVVNYYISEFNAKVDEDFWQTDFNGITPEKDLEDRAISECVKAKIQLVLCRENGIYGDISFVGLRQMAENFNTQDKSGAIGLKTIEIDTFYTYYIETGVMELKNILGEKELSPTEEEINACLEKFGTQDKNYTAARKTAISKKYDDMIEKLCKEADVQK